MRVLLSGYFGFGNTGDEMIFAVLKERLIKEGFDVKSLVKNPINEREISRSAFKEIYRAIKESDIIISGGGGLIQDRTSTKSFLYYLSILWLAKKMGKKAVVFAQGIGPVEKFYNKKILGHVLNMVDLITVRDNASKEILIRCNTKREVHVTSDLAFLYSREEKKSDEKHIVISFGRHMTIPPMETLTEIVRYVKDKTDVSVELISLFPENDSEIIKQVADSTGTNFRNISSIDEIIAGFNNSLFAIGTRYHSLVISIMKGVPFIGLSYDPKVNSLATDSDIPVLSYDSDLKLEDFKITFERAFAARETTQKNLAKKYEELKEKAEENFKLLKNVITD
jgi:polysaccharide pyruvyl transferase CsaB